MLYCFDFPNLRRWGKSHVYPMGGGRGKANFWIYVTGLFFSNFSNKNEEKHICTNFCLIKYDTEEIFFFKCVEYINRYVIVYSIVSCLLIHISSYSHVLTMGKLNSGHFMFCTTAFLRRDELSKSIWPLERSLNLLQYLSNWDFLAQSV